MAELGPGQRALRGVLWDMAACSLVTQACGSSLPHNNPVNSGFQKQPSTPKAMSNTFAVPPRHEIFVHCPRGLKTSSTFNFWPSDPGQATSPVWVSEREGLDSQAPGP